MQVIDRGDPAEILRMAMRARRAYEEGRVCECPKPILTGLDLLCGRCLLENQEQRDRREAQIRGPHQFEPMADAGLKAGFCRICVHLEDDPRHAA